MGIDLRQVVAGILTLTMFVMLGQMIKRDHFDSLQDKLPGEAQDVQVGNANVIEKDGLVKLSKGSKGPWMKDSQELKPCWSRTTFDGIEQSRGYVTFSLTNGPEYHVSQENIMPEEKKGKFLEFEGSELEKVIDFYICSKSDVFVPALSGLFYANVAGKRIALGKPQILVPADIPGTSATVTNYLSPYVAKKNHLAYSCFC
ncbi:hypothetical protein GOBAR_DD16589 [Gossypium barbadense]|nr:hypothetical protein GOBAR_DD16589 [Gossypium barbadense]